MNVTICREWSTDEQEHKVDLADFIRACLQNTLCNGTVESLSAEVRNLQSAISILLVYMLERKLITEEDLCKMVDLKCTGHIVKFPDED